MEILIVGAIIMYVLIYNNTIDKDKFFADNQKYLESLKEDDYQFLVYARYGEDVDVDQLYSKRITMAFVGFLFVLVLSISRNNSVEIINAQFFLNLVVAGVVAFGIFKLPYWQLRSYYKQHLQEIDVMLPYYLKSLEILIQHYTVPVAIGKSIGDAPEIFKPGLRRMIDRINSGDASVDPYMEFANNYPVRDSMRMMRLLYRLGIGSQERKQERLMMFSKTVSSLQAKARETKYKERLDHMESQTMVMLTCTGIGVMLVILISMMMVF
ncbi:MAG: hypothetical protein IKF71_03150 [Bacilli bacterium]|nr:hypothetical protein [Bacilli bacterium]